MRSYATIEGRDYTLSVISGRETPVESYYLALCFTEPGITVAGDELDEVNGAGYARGVLVNISANWDVIHGELVTMEQIDFPIAEEDWGEPRYWALCDSSEGGRVFWGGEFTDAVVVSEGDQPSLPAGGLTLYFGEPG